MVKLQPQICTRKFHIPDGMYILKDVNILLTLSIRIINRVKGLRSLLVIGSGFFRSQCMQATNRYIFNTIGLCPYSY